MSTEPSGGRLLTAAVLLLALLCSACHPAAPPPEGAGPEPLAWVPIPLPALASASSLASTPTGVLVGGRSASGGPHPLLLSLAPDGQPRPVSLRPHSPYAKVADLVSVASDGRRVLALGAARGGAHANVRWTVWAGTPDGLDDQPQTFETFGGQEAGSLLDVVLTAQGPVIVGSWVGSHGLDAAVWRPRGAAWVRQSSATTALANTATQQVGPRAATASPSALLIVGSVLTFSDGVRQQAAVWRRTGAGPTWELLALPDSGGSSEALSSACTTRCWVAGQVDGAVALWHLDPGPGREPALAGVGVDAAGPGPRVVLPSGAGPGVLASQAGHSVLALALDDRWHSFTAPAGTVTDATTWGSRVYAILRGPDGATTLWTTDVAHRPKT